ncbi:hypothetical protein CMV_021791 [Castanea mollissima]|uniref:Uncharacterized protein n=1 Tax=Castanea mollissima TaxID=60419 RepID=A0A8J4VC98_9ROSI|nr:hypothetical protein CMV_021791 [Castanea mollissima]
MAFSRILFCMFMLLVITNLQSQAAMEGPPSVTDLRPAADAPVWGCDPGPCKTKCCYCTVVHTRPVCATCCDDDETGVNPTISQQP